MVLAEAMNTYNVALFTIKSKGFAIELDTNDETEEINHWVAKKGEYIIYAFNPLSLLSLVVIAEEYGSSWNRVCQENLYDRILED